MSNKILRIATRNSPLALWQAKYVQNKLINFYPWLNVELVPIVTKGDLILDTSLVKLGGKGLFIKELEHAILTKKADIAVHSVKDVPIIFPEGLGLVTICKRDNPCDSFISNHYKSVNSLPKGAVVGTSSLRRQYQLSARRPDLIIRSLRGNVGSRLKKLDAGEYDAIILAAAGLKRLGLEKRIGQIISVGESLPAVGQGAIGIECFIKDVNTINLLSILNDEDSSCRIRAERAMNIHLQGSCQIPIGGYAQLQGNTLWLRGLISSLDGKFIVRDECFGPRHEAEKIGILLAEKLLNNGARKILHAVY